MAELYWYAVQVKSRHEFKVLERLTKADIEAFLPAVERLRKWKDRKKMVSFPLFQCYLFVCTGNNYEDILAVLKTKGVVKFLGIKPSEPEPVPEAQIISLKKLIDSKEALDPYPYLKEGQMVRVKRGPLSGVDGILVKKGDNHILVLSVDILQQGVSLRIDASDIEPI